MYIAVLVFYEYNSFKNKITPATSATVSAPIQIQNQNSVKTGDASVRVAQAARAGASPVSLNAPQKQILDMPKLFFNLFVT